MSTDSEGCKVCGSPRAYIDAIYCGAACCAIAEDKVIRKILTERDQLRAEVERLREDVIELTESGKARVRAYYRERARREAAERVVEAVRSHLDLRWPHIREVLAAYDAASSSPAGPGEPKP